MTTDEAIGLVPDGWFWEVALGVTTRDGSGPYWATLYPMRWSREERRDAIARNLLDFEGDTLAPGKTPSEALEKAATMAKAVDADMATVIQ